MAGIVAGPCAGPRGGPSRWRRWLAEASVSNNLESDRDYPRFPQATSAVASVPAQATAASQNVDQACVGSCNSSRATSAALPDTATRCSPSTRFAWNFWPWKKPTANGVSKRLRLARSQRQGAPVACVGSASGAGLEGWEVVLCRQILCCGQSNPVCICSGPNADAAADLPDEEIQPVGSGHLVDVARPRVRGNSAYWRSWPAGGLPRRLRWTWYACSNATHRYPTSHLNEGIDH